MCLSLLHDVRFYDHLLRIDQDLSNQIRKDGCPRCGGRLDSGGYARKVRGGPQLSEEHYKRLSLCCDRCRKRATPLSVRFYGRRVYWGGAFVLACARKLTPAWLARLCAELGVDRRTVRRWRQWWHEQFVRLAWWKAKKGRFIPPVSEQALPSSLLERFGTDRSTRLSALLQWLAPSAASGQ